MFDYLENLMVLWGNDPRELMPEPPEFGLLALDWFQRSPAVYEQLINDGNDSRVPFRVFVSIQIAQIVFGERTLDKRRLLELYDAYVPQFPNKDFGRMMIREKMEQRFPDRPPQFAPYSDYVDFDRQLAELVRASAGV